MKKLLSLALCVLLLAGCAQTYDGPTESKLVLTEYEVRRYSTISDEVWTDRYTYAYDIYGNRVQSLDYDEGELAQKTIWTYDAQGNQLTTTDWDYTGWIPHIDSKSEMTYDDQNRLLTDIRYDMWGRETGRSTYTYDDEANTMTWSSDSGDQVIYYYDENGLQIRGISTGAGGTYETVYEYDARGNRIGWTSTRDGAPFDRYEAGYDDQDRQIWGAHYDANDTRISYVTYTYDDEAHTTTIHRPNDDIRIEYYDAEGRIRLIEDRSEEGDLSMVQQYIYRDIQVPANAEEG